MNSRTIFEIILLLAALILAYFLFRNNSISNEISLLKRDTIYIENKRDPIILEKIKPKLVYLKDSIISTKPFKALVDTVIKKDTIKIDYQFPENNLNLTLKSEKDTLKVPELISTVEEKPGWKDFLPAFLIGIILGLIGVIIK